MLPLCTVLSSEEIIAESVYYVDHLKLQHLTKVSPALIFPCLIFLQN